MPITRIIARAFAGMASAVLALTMLAGLAAQAQEISQSHIDAALRALTSARAARGFDDVLPALSQRVQNQLIRVRPDLHKEITDVVDTVALKLVARRADLDLDVARVWARNFTEPELNAIADFYSSEAGQKFAEIGPRVINDSLQAVQGWSDRVGEEMLQKAREEFELRGIEF